MPNTDQVAKATELGTSYLDKPVDVNNGIPFDIYEIFEQVTDRDYEPDNDQDDRDVLTIAAAFENGAGLAPQGVRK
jgi:hypothetical protein